MTNQNTGWKFDNSYAKLQSKLFTFAQPDPVRAPNTLLFNYKLATAIGLKIDPTTEAAIANKLSGNELLEGSQPLAQAYAGHQFGHFAMLGDGRAILLGEHITPNNTRLDIQLKGPGATPYSRRGDGRATLRSMLREYLISEAMYGLGIPTSRSLAVVTSGEPVYREEVHEGAILTRIASSHIRVGTFEYIHQFLGKEDLEAYTQYVIERHYPDLKTSKNPAFDLFKAVMDRQIDLIVHWMRVGFIHGVMNTDNMSIAGETFDYGPCAFMNAYNPATVFSAIDTNGRYAFGNQPKIAQWNLACLASALLPIIHTDHAEAVQMAQAVLNDFPALYEQKWGNMMGNKLGFNNAAGNIDVQELIQELLQWMALNGADYSNTFLVIQSDTQNWEGIYAAEPFLTWYARLQFLWKELGIDIADAVRLMQRNNPAFIPRNHLVEQALDEVCLSRDFTLFNQMLEVAGNPYVANLSFSALQMPSDTGDRLYKTYCGT
jgi:serine/tyrosine/threonine adenylyltransferase